MKRLLNFALTLKLIIAIAYIPMFDGISLCLQSVQEVLDSHLVRVQVKACGLRSLDLEVILDYF